MNKSDNQSNNLALEKELKKGNSNLATTNPELAKEWNPTKNGNLKPTDVSFKSNRIVWWYILNEEQKTENKHKKY